MMNKIAGVVVLFNPSTDIYENINSYLDQVEVLFVIDNSETLQHSIIDKIKNQNNIIYKSNGKNLGIARALNIGASLAIEQHYDFLLMMDQDSILSSNMISESLQYFTSHPLEKIGVLYPYHVYRNYNTPKEKMEYKEIFVADTSGSLLNLEAYRQVGPFLDALFIDYVDFEYCLRLKLNGYKIIQLNNVRLFQVLGNMVTRDLLALKVSITNHQPWRIYYRVRNRILVARKYFVHFPKWSLWQMFYPGIELMKIILFEHKKVAKCRMVVRGIWHGIIKRYNDSLEKG